MADLPGSVLFCCTQNALRSPMAEGILKMLHGKHVFVDSVGVRGGELDPFAVVAMDEIGIDISRHRAEDLRQSRRHLLRSHHLHVAGSASLAPWR